MPEKNTIVSVGWDKTIRIWRSYKKKLKLRKSEDGVKKFDTWVFDQMKTALKNSQIESTSKNSYMTELDLHI